jgi:hypothetical protein
MTEAKDLKAYETANRPASELETSRSELYFWGSTNDTWVMADDQSHEYKIDRMLTKSDTLAVVLAVNGFAILDSRDENGVILLMKRVY